MLSSSPPEAAPRRPGGKTWLFIAYKIAIYGELPGSFDDPGHMRAAKPAAERRTAVVMAFVKFSHLARRVSGAAVDLGENEKSADVFARNLGRD